MFTQTTVINCLRSISNKPTTYENASPLKNCTLLLEIQVKYVQNIISTSNTANLGTSRKEVIQVISDIVKENCYFKTENNFD